MSKSVRRVAIIGAAGQLGSDIVEVFSSAGRYELIPLSHSDIEITDVASVHSALKDQRPDVVINTAAFHQVDVCEDRPGKAFEVNACGTLNVARACGELDALNVFISTDYVFDGCQEAPYDEESATTPINVYGASKLAGEHLVMAACKQNLVMRIASVFGKAGARGKGGNFLDKILARARSGQPLTVVDDTCMSPTYTRDAANLLDALLGAGASGIFHGANTGACSWFELATKAVELAGLDVPVKPVSSDTFVTKASRPTNSSLVSKRLGEYSIPPTQPWQGALKDYMIEMDYIQE